MSYINAKDVQAIRKELKIAFPGYKFNVRKDRHTSVDVTLVSGPMDFTDILQGQDHGEINPYHLGNYGKHQQMFQTIVDIVKTAPARGDGYWAGKGWYDRSDSQSDYFDTAYYFRISVGDWAKPYQQVTKRTTTSSVYQSRKSLRVKIPAHINVEAAKQVASKEVTVQELLASVGIDARVLLGEATANMRVVA